MKVTCGVDIIEIERIKENIENEKTGKSFIEKVFTKKEIEYCESKKSQKYQHYAARFAAKEATFKAISHQINDKYSVSWQNIEIINDKQGKPNINIEKLNLKNIQSIDLSISHCKQYAIANVVLLEKY